MDSTGLTGRRVSFIVQDLVVLDREGEPASPGMPNDEDLFSRPSGPRRATARGGMASGMGVPVRNTHTSCIETGSLFTMVPTLSGRLPS